MTARSISLTRNSTSASAIANQTWDMAFATEVEFTSYVCDVFAADTYTLTIDGVTVETKAVAATATGVTFTPAAPMALSAGVHTFALVGTGSRRFYYLSGVLGQIAGDPQYAVWGSWTLATNSHHPAGTINFTEDGTVVAGGVQQNSTTGTTRTGQTWSATFDVDVSFTGYFDLIFAAGTYDFQIDGSTVASVTTSNANQVAAFIPASPVTLASGAHTFALLPTVSKNFHQRTTLSYIGDSHVTAWGIWQEVAAANVVPGRLAYTLSVNSGAGSLSLSGSGGAQTPGVGSGDLSLSGASTTASGAVSSGALVFSATGGTDAPSDAAGTGSLSLSGSGGAAFSAAGTGSLTFGAVSEAVALYETDTSNAFDGLDLLLTATVTFHPTPATAPATLTLAERYDKAVPYPPPVVLNGRVL